jgi:hypothetical protein
MDQVRRFKEIFENKSKRGIRGRLRLRWLEAVEKELQEMKLKR